MKSKYIGNLVFTVAAVFIAFGIFFCNKQRTSAEGERFPIRSNGNLIYENGNGAGVEVYTEDIQYLKEELQKLESEIP